MGTVAIPPQELGMRDQFMMRLFSDLQMARFNELYYQIRAAKERSWVTRMNILAALSSGGALVGMLGTLPAIGGYNPGGIVAGLLTVSAGICASVGPVLGLESKATQLEKAAFGYCIIRERIKRLLNDLRLRDLDESHHARDMEISSLRDSLAALDEHGIDEIREMAWKKVEEEYPSESAWSNL